MKKRHPWFLGWHGEEWLFSSPSPPVICGLADVCAFFEHPTPFLDKMIAQFEPMSIPWIAPYNEARFPGFRIALFEEVLAKLKVIVMAVHT